ncbi:flagellar protein FlgN [Gaiella occulta]|uniref:flagellar protein FlgN n=1 Tax=Gaiella occulta TaxID=1002870 RepID=UPI001C68ACAB|nr:flagellar protein FlgN [Gaiella occulta]
MSAAALAGHLASQVELQRKLLSLAHAEEEALRRGDLRALRTITAEQEGAVLDGARLERARADEALRLCEQLGLGPDASAAELAAALPGDEGDGLEQAAAELRALVAELLDLNRRNRSLIEQELGTIDHLVRGVILGQASRTDDARALPPAPPRLVDREA